MVTGGFRSREVMEKALGSGQVAVLGIGRPLCVQTCCVRDLLDRKLERLPSPENEWDLPWLARWTRYLILGNLMKVGGELCAYYWNLYRIGAGEPALEKPNLLRAVQLVGKKDDMKARSLKGLPNDDPTVRYYNDTSISRGGVLGVLLLAIILYYSLGPIFLEHSSYLNT